MWISRIVYTAADGFCTLSVGRSSIFIQLAPVLQTPDENASAYQVYVLLFCVVPVASSMILSVYLYQLTHKRRVRTEAASERIGTPLSLSAKVKSGAYEAMGEMRRIFAHLNRIRIQQTPG